MERRENTEKSTNYAYGALGEKEGKSSGWLCVWREKEEEGEISFPNGWRLMESGGDEPMACAGGCCFEDELFAFRSKLASLSN